MEKPELIVFTDLDGTLLDPVTYSPESALEGIALCRDRDIPVVPVTSKTLGECRELVHNLKLSPMTIFENGGGLIDPEGETITLGMTYPEIREVFTTLQREFAVRGFGDMPISEIAQRTGLGLSEAELAKARQFSEPFIYEGDSPTALAQAVERLGMRLEIGNRFFHLIGPTQSKGAAVQALINLLELSRSKKYKAIGFGDSPNDLSFLDIVHYPVFVGRREILPLSGNRKNLRYTERTGPVGWTEGIRAVLAELGRLNA